MRTPPVERQEFVKIAQVGLCTCGSSRRVLEQYADAGPHQPDLEPLSGRNRSFAVRIDVDPADTVAAGVAAGELARTVRQITGRLESVGPTSSGAAALAAWATTWATLRTTLLALASTGEELAGASRAAELRFRQTESGLMVPDVS